MQQTQQQGASERISWARAMIFAIGFFFLSALLVGQIPSYINLQLTAASLQGMEIGSLGLGLVCLGGFAIIQVIVLLFDPKPLVPPIIFTGLGTVLSLGGLAIVLLSSLTGCSATQTTCNQYFPTASSSWNPVLGGKVLWFQPGAVDFVALGIAILAVGVAMIFYSQLALREQRNPDRRDLGTTPTIRWLIIVGSILLVAFMVFYTYADVTGLGTLLFPSRPYFGTRLVTLCAGLVLGASIFTTAGAFALRLHYLMRPVRKRTMSGLYAIGALGLAQLGVILIIAWFVIYPLMAWMHSWTFIGLGDYLTVCGRKTFVPGSCAFSQQGGYIVNAIVTTNFFVMLMGAVWAWKSHRNLVVIGSVVTMAVIAAGTLLVHTAATSNQILTAMMLCAGMLILAAVWTSVSRREFAIVGEKNLGCLGQWLVVGTCLFIYIGAFAFFSVPVFPETETNITFQGGVGIPPVAPAGQTAPIVYPDAMVVVFVMAILAAIQFYFLTRNRYKV
ncbi:MAG TPA: hypothetical protein VEL31_08470 [Ktedonobacteraceae bacterium]|nr:hypothetical protein [Ktedonobacteraceae bacterium]